MNEIAKLIQSASIGSSSANSIETCAGASQLEAEPTVVDGERVRAKSRTTDMDQEFALLETRMCTVFAQVTALLEQHNTTGNDGICVSANFVPSC